MKPIFRTMNKVGIVVESIDNTVKIYAEDYNIAPWKIWDLNSRTVDEMAVNNERMDYAVRIAQTNIGHTVWELIEPQDDKTIFSEFLEAHGEGLHHLGYEVKSLKKVTSFLRNMLVPIKQSGNWSGYHFAFFDTTSDLKYIAEVYETGKNFSYPDPVTVYSEIGQKMEIERPFMKRPTQIGIVVKDLQNTTKIYYDKYGIGPWVMLEYYTPKVNNMCYFGKEATDQCFTVAAAMIGDMQLELMETKSGNTIYKDWIEEHGEGLHHIQFEYNYPFSEVIKYFNKKNHTVMQEGIINGLTYAYIDTENDLKTISEPLDIPADFQYPENEYSYPEGLRITDVLP